VSGISGARKLGVVARVAARQAGQMRWNQSAWKTLRAAWSGARITLEHFARVLRLLWLQIVGVFFLFFAAAGAVAARREYLHWQAGTVGPGKMARAVGFALVFVWFGVTSFWRAGRKSSAR